MTLAYPGLRKVLAPAALLAGSWFVLDHLLPDLLPKPPQIVSLWIVGLAGLVATTASVGWGWTLLNEYLPRPWWPKPFWRVTTWLRRRPTLSVITAVPKVGFGNTTMDSCRVSLTLRRNLARLAAVSTVEFDEAVLILSQTIGRKTRRFAFAPCDAGGFLALPVAAGASDAVLVEFVGIAFPKPMSEAPDFTLDYHLELRGVRVRVQGKAPIAAELAPASWSWFHQFNSGIPPRLELTEQLAAM